MRHELNRVPQFYVTAPQKCPYIKGKIERKLFTALYGRNTVNLNDELSLQGFRRSQKVLYRPLCSNCSACLSIRIKVNEFYLINRSIWPTQSIIDRYLHVWRACYQMGRSINKINNSMY